MAPLNAPPATVSPAIAGAAHEASTDAYHLAMLVAAGLLFLGAAVNAIGIRNQSTADAVESAATRAAETAG